MINEIVYVKYIANVYILAAVNNNNNNTHINNN